MPVVAGRRVIAVCAAVALGATLAGCGSSGGGSGDPSQQAQTITLYNGQHESTTKMLVADFTKATGIKVQVRSGEGPELANQIRQEGSASPADVIYTENSPALTLLSEKGKLAKVDKKTLQNIPSKYDSPQGDWVGVAARETVLVYNPSKITKSQLPRSIMDLSSPQWKGKVGIAPPEGDFHAIVAAVLASQGKQKTQKWLQGLKANSKTFNGNEAVVQAVNRGQLPVGIVYHYYWYRDQAESGANSSHTKLYYFGHQDPGAFLSVSGAGVLKSSQHKQAAQRFLQFLTSKRGQQDLAKSDDFEYPLNPQVQANPKLKPLKSLQAPKITPGEIGDGTQAVSLLRDAGLLG